MKYLIIVSFILISYQNSFSQKDTSKSMDLIISQGMDSTLIDFDEDESFYKMNINKKILNYTKIKPIIEVQLGISQAFYNYDELGVLPANFSNLKTSELRLGTIDITNNYKNNPNLIRSTNSYFFLKSYTGTASNLANPNLQTTEGYGLGWNKNEGYGYKLGEKSFISFYHGDGHYWSFININNASKENKLDYFGKNVLRFGKQFQSGIMINPISNLNFSFEYQRSLIFPRHMFWYEIGSNIVENVAEGAIGIFTNKIKKFSPELYPIVKFVFDTGLSYGFYELRKKDMNWPIKTASPLLIDSYKIGVSYSF